ncbi:uncharacterized protein BDV14DRAFT_201386 [Aspergillus stella-maris]|uniref:uncharacterized protein n=1 Tax=Aspergillus stella-maris TaxID=1810926 RepID=UPI003CCE502D
MPSKSKKKPRNLKGLSRWVGKTFHLGSSKTSKTDLTSFSQPANTGMENSNNVEPQATRSSNVGNLPNINTTPLDVSFQVRNSKVKNSNCADLPSPRLRVPVTGGAKQGSEQHTSQPIESDLPPRNKENLFRRRIRTLTTSSSTKPAVAKESPKLKRHSLDSKSSSVESSRVWSASHRDSNSTTTQDTESATPSPSISTVTPDIKDTGKTSDGEGVESLKKLSATSALRYIRSPNGRVSRLVTSGTFFIADVADYMFVDFNYNEVQARAAMNNRPSNEQMVKEPEIGKSSFEELLAYVRCMTGTEVDSTSKNNPKAARRPEDARPWKHRNLACIGCRKTCPTCNKTCCVKQELEQKAADENLSPEEAQKAKHLGKIIEHLGFYAQEVSTFTQCTPFDGCGRYVCPDCSGVCPNEICRDIQCKDCKLNPWDACDWHG